MSRLEHRTFEDAHAIGLVAQEAVAAYLSLSPEIRVWPADHPVSGASYYDAQKRPMPDLIKLEKGKGVTLVEVKAKKDWWQEGGNKGPIETVMEDQQIRSYCEVSAIQCAPVAVVFVMRIDPTVLINGFKPRGYAGCWWAKLEDLHPLLRDEKLATWVNRREGGKARARKLYRIQEGGPLRPMAPWDELTKSVPMDPASWAAWRILEPNSANPVVPLTHQSGPQCGSPSH